MFNVMGGEWPGEGMHTTPYGKGSVSPLAVSCNSAVGACAGFITGLSLNTTAAVPSTRGEAC